MQITIEIPDDLMKYRYVKPVISIDKEGQLKLVAYECSNGVGDDHVVDISKKA